MADEGRTIARACELSAAAGIPVTPRQLRGIIRFLPGFQRTGEVRRPPGSKGGRGDPLYSGGELQDLITGIERWVKPPAPGDA